MAFVSTRDGDYAIFVMNADGSRQKRLTHERGDPSTPQGLLFQVDPAWSPDGRRITFVSKRGGPQQVYVVDGDGSGLRRLTSTAKDDSSPSWSPNGRSIVFSREGALFLLSVTTGRASRLVPGLGNASDPVWSPDGKALAYDYRVPGESNREIWVARSDGSHRRRLTGLHAVAASPSWSPDGRWIAFSADLTGTFHVYAVKAVGKEVRRLTNASTDDVDPAWSPDGKKIAFSRDGAIWTVDARGGHARRLTNAKNNDSSPAWKPGANS